MAFSWIFSGKKKEEKPVTVEAVEVGSDEDYAIIQASPTQTGIYPEIPPALYPYTPLPYPMLPQRQNQQITGNSVLRTNSVQNQLDGVPFILSKNFEQSLSTNQLFGVEDLKRAVFQIVSDINGSVFDYNFQMERSVLDEASLFKNRSEN